MAWVIQVMRKLSGEEYPTIIEKELLNKQQQTERLPAWRLVTVPPEYAHLDATSILQACYTARIDWRKVEKNERVTKRPSPRTDPRSGD
jgi:hypothetical protein